MALCSVADVRAKIFTVMLDADITNIIAEVSEEVLELAGTTSETSSTLQLAGKYAAYAATLRRMKSTGELAQSVKSGNYTQQNTTDIDIQDCEQKYQMYLKRYKNVNFLIVSGRIGFKTVNSEL